MESWSFLLFWRPVPLLCAPQRVQRMIPYMATKLDTTSPVNACYLYTSEGHGTRPYLNSARVLSVPSLMLDTGSAV